MLQINRLQHNVNITFIYTGKQKKMCDLFSCDIFWLQWSGTELKYLWNVPVCLGISRQPTQPIYSPCVHDSLQEQESVQFSSVQSLSSVRLFATPWIAAGQDSLSITNSWSLLKLKSTESVMPSSHLILCHPLLLLPPTPPSTRGFSNESALHMRWPKYWSSSFSISHSNEHPGLISFRVDMLDLLAVQGTLNTLLQHQSSKSSILQHWAFFTVQLSHP